MEQVSFPLPIRLLPRKGGQLFQLLFFIFFTGFSVFWMVMAGAMTWFTGDDVPWFTKLFPAFGLLFFVTGTWQLIQVIAKLLPGSPFHHFDISKEGLAIRKLGKKVSFAWSELSPFDVSVRAHQNEGGKSFTYHVVALRAVDAAMLVDERERYKRAIVRIEAGEFGSDGAPQDASDLAAWLNDLRDMALDHRLGAQSDVSVPPGFRRSIRLGHGAAATPRSASHRSVVQR